MYKRILVALDGSEGSGQVLPWVRALALPDKASIVLLHVCPEPQLVAVDGQVVRFVDEEEALLRLDALRYLEPLARRLEASGILVEGMVRFGEPAERILEVAREVGADLIALATRGRSGLGRLLHGSVAAWVLRRAEVPVLLLRREERQAA
jgi:nucleotide-binding universal stress UspA family protein